MIIMLMMMIQRHSYLAEKIVQSETREYSETVHGQNIFFSNAIKINLIMSFKVRILVDLKQVHLGKTMINSAV